MILNYIWRLSESVLYILIFDYRLLRLHVQHDYWGGGGQMIWLLLRHGDDYYNCDFGVDKFWWTRVLIFYHRCCLLGLRVSDIYCGLYCWFWYWLIIFQSIAYTEKFWEMALLLVVLLGRKWPGSNKHNVYLSEMIIPFIQTYCDNYNNTKYLLFLNFCRQICWFMPYLYRYQKLRISIEMSFGMYLPKM